MSLLAAALSLAMSTDEPIGKLSEAEFLGLFTKMGYTRHSTNQKAPFTDIKKLKSGSTEFLISWTNYKDTESDFTFVGALQAIAVFDVPRPLSKADFTDWMKAEGFEKITGYSYLGGRLKLESHLLEKDSSFQNLKKRTDEFAAAVQKVKLMAENIGGRQAQDVFGAGSAKFDPNFKLDWIDDRDVEFLRTAMGWKEGSPPGGGKGWLVPIQFGRAQIYVNGMSGMRGVLLICGGRPDKTKVERFRLTPKPADWAEISVTPEMVDILFRLNAEKGITAKALAETIENFGRRVNSLDLF